MTTKCLGKFFSNLRPYSVSFVNNISISSKKTNCRTSLVVKRLRICLPMLGMQGQSLTQGHSTSWGATKPMRPKYWSHTPETVSNNYWACVHEGLCSTTREATATRESSHAARRPSPTKKKTLAFEPKRFSLYETQSILIRNLVN